MVTPLNKLDSNGNVQVTSLYYVRRLFQLSRNRRQKLNDFSTFKTANILYENDLQFRHGCSRIRKLPFDNKQVIIVIFNKL